MRRTKQAALETRERILDCAELVFSEKGVTDTTLENIAAAAKVTRGAIYGHFRNKADVFDAMVDRVQLPLEAFVEAAADPREPDPLGRMRGALAMCLRDVAQDPHSHRVFDVLFTKSEYSAHMSGLLARTTASARTGRARLARGLRNAMRQGQLPADLDTRRAAAALHAFVCGVLRDWLLDDASISLPADAGRMAEASIDMLRFSAALRKPPRSLRSLPP